MSFLEIPLHDEHAELRAGRDDDRTRDGAQRVEGNADEIDDDRRQRDRGGDGEKHEQRSLHVALPVPNETEGGQWYFQRYVEQLPTRGEIAFFDRSWYNRAGVERVMGFATDSQVARFFDQVVPFEQFLVDDGIHLIKIWLSVGRDEQARRLTARRADPLKQWKLSPLDERAPSLWEDYTLAALELFRRTDTPEAPWWFVNNNNKRVGRLNVIQHVLRLLPYDGKDVAALGDARQDIVAPVRALLPIIAPDP